MKSDRADVLLDLSVGHMREVAFADGPRKLRPLHNAPWVDGKDVPEAPPVLQRLSGDFLCAPFCSADVEAAPWHGWTANSPWAFLGQRAAPANGQVFRFELQKRVLGARVLKEITLRDGHPVVYQRHLFEGGAGSLPIAHHVMLRTDGGLRLSFSPKQFGLTPKRPLTQTEDAGTSVLAYPQEFDDPRRVLGRDGAVIDITTQPFASVCEEYVFLFEAEGRELGWSAAVNPTERYAFFAVKSPQTLPATHLWVSNFGLLTSPWEGRHGACLGIEEICSNLAEGHHASSSPNELEARGVQTALRLDPAGVVAVDYAFGCMALDDDWDHVKSLSVAAGQVELRDASGHVCAAPFFHSLNKNNLEVTS